MNASSLNKILVATLHWVPNFGANLQAYAVNKALKENGADPVFLNFRPKELVEKGKTEVSQEQRNAHENFVITHLAETPLIESQTDFENYLSTSDHSKAITGSDAVFRLTKNSKRADLIFPNPFWLSPELKAYSLSPTAMGCRYDTLPSSTQTGIHNAINSFEEVSVRDTWTLTQLRKAQVTRHIHVLPDPVFLLRERIQNLKNERSPKRPYIVLCNAHTLSDKWVESFTTQANKEGFDVLGLPTPEGLTSRNVNQVVPFPLSPLDWAKTIAQSSGYIGVRFHPIVVSLIAGIPIVALDLYQRGYIDSSRSKTVAIMKTFQCQNYCIGRIPQKWLTPNSALKMLLRQRNELKGRTAIAAQLEQSLASFIKRIINS